MACGENGTGRFPEPKLIIENIIIVYYEIKVYKINLKAYQF